MRVVGSVLSVVSSLLVPASLVFAEDFAAWSHHADLIINTSATGANVSGRVTGFPLLVRLDASVFNFTEASGNGSDVRFTNAAGKILPYEIERWDSAGRAAEIWVKTDTIQGNTADQVLKMHWGYAPAAAESNGGSVFDSGSGYVSVWHLGGTGNRANSVSGGQAAVPVNYATGASKAGIIGSADSLTGGVPGSYLDIGDGYGMFANGFTFSAWVKPVGTGYSVHFLDIGNGGGQDNIAFGRYQQTQNASFVTYNGTSASQIAFADAAVAPEQWQLLTVTVSGTAIKIYRNGTLVSSETLTQSINSALRTSNFLGKGNWSSNDYYKGVMDEPRLMKTALGPNSIKLAYETQRPDQKTVLFKKAAPCVAKFSAGADTAVAEGSVLELTGVAECAELFAWSGIEGPTPRILDPEVLTLRVLVPRVTRDTVLKYRFTATFSGIDKSQELNIHVKETIPDPSFTLPPYLEWDGSQNLVIQPVIQNLTAVTSSASPSIQFLWTLVGVFADTTVLDGALMVRPMASEPEMKVGLCMDNGGSSICHQVLVTTANSSTTGLLKGLRGPAGRDLRPRYDAAGRRIGYGVTLKNSSHSTGLPFVRR
jgi:hypothetical protein